MCRGIFAGSARNLSMRSAFPAIHRYESSHGSIIAGGLMTKSGEPWQAYDGLVVSLAGL